MHRNSAANQEDSMMEASQDFAATIRGPAPPRRQANYGMVNEPPHRVTMRLPNSKPLAAVTGTGGPAALPEQMQRGGIGKHALSRPIDSMTKIPLFATNMKIGSRMQMTVDGPVVNLPVGSMKQPTYRGWVEPQPGNVPKRNRSTMTDLPITVVQRILMYSLPADIDRGAVQVCRRWCQAVNLHPVLTARRFAFEFDHDYDGRGILYYLGWKMNSAGRVAVNGRIGVNSMHRNAWHNPSVGTFSVVSVACSHLVSESVTRAHHKQVLPTRDDGTPRTAAMKAVLQRANAAASRDDGRTLALSEITHCGVSHFSTENLPYAWVGVDFKDYRVKVTHYTVGTSVQDQPVFPLQWELQGAFQPGSRGNPIGKRQIATNTATGYRPPANSESFSAEEREWGTLTWYVLDRRSGEFFSDSKRSATFEVNQEVVEARGAMARLRIVQTGKNSQWGNELCVSGLEFYGNLFKS